MKTSRTTLKLWLRAAIERVEEVASTLDGTEKGCQHCGKHHYVNLTEGRAKSTLLSAVTRIKKGAREAGIDLEN